MSCYLIFSDECGAYIPKPNEGFLKSHPFYSRSSVIIPSDSYVQLRKDYFELKEIFGIPHNFELKWSDIWRLRIIQKRGDELGENHRLNPIKDIDYHNVIEFVSQAVSIFTSIEKVKIFFTITLNHKNMKASIGRYFEMHIENHLQRTQYALQELDASLGILFYDSVNTKSDKLLKRIYKELLNENKFDVEFELVKDSLNIDFSHQSVGIQLTDFIAGCCNSFFKSFDNPDNYQIGVELFRDNILPNLRSKKGKFVGYGVIEIPSDSSFRGKISAEIQNLLS